VSLDLVEAMFFDIQFCKIEDGEGSGWDPLGAIGTQGLLAPLSEHTEKV